MSWLYFYEVYYVYLLRFKDSKHYTGCIADLKKRYKQHVDGEVQATARNLPVELLFYCAFIDRYKAFDFERYLKGAQEEHS